MQMSAKALARKCVDATILPLVSYVVDRVGTTATVDAVLASRALMDSADYAHDHMQDALSFGSREQLWAYALKRMNKAGTVAEFGVWNGYSINYFAKRVPGKVYGFDSFQGLHVDWAGTGCQKEHFSLKGRLPKVERNVELIVGWFDETLPDFFCKHPDILSLIHIDCDTYEATKIVLDCVGSRIKPGTVVIFDEYFGYRGWRRGEFKAWSEFVDASGTDYKYLGFARNEVAVAIL
jgi:hypothetical protein